MSDSTQSGGWRVGIDIGGTFTDILAVHTASGRSTMAKVGTDPNEPLRGLDMALQAVELAWTDVDELVHGTTMVTNALVESRLASVALVATRNFSDVLDIGRASRDVLYQLDALPRHVPDVPAAQRFGIAGRMEHDGREREPLDPDELAALADRIAATGAEAVAVALLHGYANPAHENAVCAALEGRLPFISVSHQINPEAREFERTSTTVVNASVMPMVGRYMDRLSAAAPETTDVQLFHSAGGMAPPQIMRERPLALALSGPAAGAAGAAAVAGELGLEHAISFDMGGTTTDVCLIRDGRVEIRSDRRIGGRAIRQPMAAIETIGAGGGSIVSISSGGLSIGPQSAGADPGPACYGKGGTQPTISDVDLLLGYLDPERPLAGTITLDSAAATRALDPITGQLDQDIQSVAFGVLQVAHAVMARAVRRVSVDRGIDARQCALIAFGGAGPMHACGLVDEMGIDTIVVPAASGGFSAFGCVRAQMRYTHQQTIRLSRRAWTKKGFGDLRADMVAKASVPLHNAGHSTDQIEIDEIALMRYAGQAGTVEVPIGPDADSGQLALGFHAAHKALYGFATDEDWIVEALRATARAKGDAVAINGIDGNDARTSYTDTVCRFPGHGAVNTPRLDRKSLSSEMGEIAGPLLIVDDWSTVVVTPDFNLRVTPLGHLLLSRRQTK